MSAGKKILLGSDVFGRKHRRGPAPRDAGPLGTSRSGAEVYARFPTDRATNWVRAVVRRRRRALRMRPVAASTSRLEAMLQQSMPTMPTITMVANMMLRAMIT
jgi:hypothetical protein